MDTIGPGIRAITRQLRSILVSRLSPHLSTLRLALRLILRLILFFWSVLSRKRKKLRTVPASVPRLNFKATSVSPNSHKPDLGGYTTTTVVCASHVPISAVPTHTAPPASVPERLYIQPSASTSSSAGDYQGALRLAGTSTHPSTPTTEANIAHLRPESSLGHAASGAQTQGRSIAGSRLRTASSTSLNARRGPQSRVGAAPQATSRPISWQAGSGASPASSARLKRSKLSLRSQVSVNVIPPQSPPGESDGHSSRRSVAAPPATPTLSNHSFSSTDSLAYSHQGSPRPRPHNPSPEPNASPQQATPAHRLAPAAEDSEWLDYLQPCTPLDFQDIRYNNPLKISSQVPNGVYIIEAGTREFEPASPQSSEWTRCIHPEGSVYWFHSERRVYTSSDLSNPKIFDIADNIAAVLPYQPETDYAILVDFDAATETLNGCWYYIADHQTRVVKWLHDYNAEDMLNEAKGFVDQSQFKYEFESQYWAHRDLFPHDQKVDKSLLKELTGLLIFASHDAIQSKYPTTPYSLDELNNLISIVKTLSTVLETGPSASCVVARMMSALAHERYVHYAGQRCARLARNQRVLEDANPSRSRYFWLISLFLFRAPHIQVQQLEHIWIDKMVNQVPWREFLERAQGQWRDIVLNSTVLLTVNMALLAVPSVDNEFTRYRSSVQVLSYVSSLTSIGAIIIGVSLIRKYNPLRSTAADAFKHLNRRHGLDTLAATHSLPYAAFLWSMVTFLAAFLALAFDRTYAPTRATVAIVCGLVCGLVLWCANDAWDRTHRDRLLDYLRPFGARIGVMKETEPESEEPPTTPIGNTPGTVEDETLNTSVKKRHKWWKPPVSLWLFQGLLNRPTPSQPPPNGAAPAASTTTEHIPLQSMA